MDKYTIRRFFRTFGVPGLVTYMIFAMALVFVGDLLTEGKFTLYMDFDRSLVLSGQVWRVLTFALLPVDSSPLWMVVSAILYVSISRTLEEKWGEERLTRYILLLWVLTLAAGFVTGFTTNLYMIPSLFIVYGILFPHQRFNLFFAIPVEAWVLAIVDLAVMVYWAVTNWAVTGGISLGVVGATLITLGVFFRKEIVNGIKTIIRKIRFKAGQ